MKHNVVVCPDCPDKDELLAKAVKGPPSLISEREKTHGPFDETAWFYCELTKAIVEFHSKEAATFEIHASLDMILMKIARIAAGNAMHEDHWQDIIGYSELALASIRRAKE